MDAYNDQQLSESSAPRGNFLYASPILYGSAANSSGNNNNHENNQMGMNSSNMLHHLHTDEDHHQRHQIFQSSPVIKNETTNSSYKFQNHYPLNMRAFGNQQQENESSSEENKVDAIKAKIVSHPQYMDLLEAYMDCQKVGAPPEVVARLAAARQDLENRHRSSEASKDASKDPELDQFMEAYYDMLVKYREELSRPLQEAMDFMRRIESQLNMLGAGPIRIFNSDEKRAGAGSSEEDQENSGEETELPEIDPRAEDRELKIHLMRKYSGYLSSLKQELSKKKKKGKLPKEARQKLLSWWELHYKWPYPSLLTNFIMYFYTKKEDLRLTSDRFLLFKETEKVALAEATGLDQKQINNWFINQRKRHWKPSEDMQFMVMDGIHPQSGALYMDGHYMGDGPYRLGP